MREAVEGSRRQDFRRQEEAGGRRHCGGARSDQQERHRSDETDLRRLAERLLVQPIEETETKKGGIIIPDTAKEKPQEGKVVALGTGKIDDNGKKVDFTVKSGDKVLISKYGGTEIKIDGDTYLIMREDDILGIIG